MAEKNLNTNVHNSCHGHEIKKKICRSQTGLEGEAQRFNTNQISRNQRCKYQSSTINTSVSRTWLITG